MSDLYKVLTVFGYAATGLVASLASLVLVVSLASRFESIRERGQAAAGSALLVLQVASPFLALVLVLADAVGVAKLVFAAWLVFLIVAGVPLLVVEVAQIRRIQDVPTARIRSAAQGFVEVQGTTVALGEPTRCPHCGMSCIWWSVLERGLRRSSRQFFGVVDGTDFCLIDPRGADLRSAGSSSHWLAYHLRAGQPVYVIGDFRTDRGGAGSQQVLRDAQREADSMAMERVRTALATEEGRADADTSGDGAIDMTERQAFIARIRAKVAGEYGLSAETQVVHTMGCPDDPGLPFIISEGRQAETVSERRHGAAWQLGGMLVAALLLIRIVG